MKRACIRLAAVLLLSSAALAQSATPSADAYTNTSSGTKNFGTAATLNVQSPSQSAYIQFDLSSIPAAYTGASVAKASLKVYVNAVTTAGSFNVDFVNGTWSEKTITANLSPALGTTIAASVPLTSANVHDYIIIDITSAVQAWLSGTANDGIALVGNSPLNASFDSKENTGSSHSPELDIVFNGSGAQGPAGPAGPPGPIGATGAQGTQGPGGAIGPVGPQGAAGAAGINNRGSWVPLTQYQINDSVGYEGSSWIALVPNIDSAPTSINANWQVLAAKGINNQGSWVPTTNYQANDSVTDGGQYWLALAPNSFSEPAITNPNWQLLAAAGAPGAQGPQGAQGSSGPTGPAGPSGPAGTSGATGAQGPAGPAGPVGPGGPAGAQGLSGPVGPIGPEGPAGPTGIKNQGNWAASMNYQINDAVTDGGQFWLAVTPNLGSEPSAVNSNWQLIAASGAAGPAGPQGPAGPAGPQGSTGQTGLTGSQGPAGSTGATGAQGPQGQLGPQGPPGSQGPQGTMGPQGPAGGSGVVSIFSFGGGIGTIPGSASAWVFAGPTVSVTTTAGQRLTASAIAALALASGGPQIVGLDMCFQPSAGGGLANFTNYAIVQMGTVRISYPVAGSTLPGAGTWNVGYCVLNNGGAVAISNNDFVEGWVMVTN